MESKRRHMTPDEIAEAVRRINEEFPARKAAAVSKRSSDNNSQSAARRQRRRMTPDEVAEAVRSINEEFPPHRRKALSPQDISEAVRRIDEDGAKIPALAKELGVTRQALGRRVKELREERAERERLIAILRRTALEFARPPPQLTPPLPIQIPPMPLHMPPLLIPQPASALENDLVTDALLPTTGSDGDA